MRKLKIEWVKDLFILDTIYQILEIFFKIIAEVLPTADLIVESTTR